MPDLIIKVSFADPNDPDPQFVDPEELPRRHHRGVVPVNDTGPSYRPDLYVREEILTPSGTVYHVVRHRACNGRVVWLGP